MTRNSTIVELGTWLQSAPGHYLMAWEQEWLDRAVTDAFGFHALQLGLPQIDGLRANRMPHRWLGMPAAVAQPVQAEAEGIRATALLCDFDALPFPNSSLDLVVMPHALELARDPHLALREVERVLVNEGRLVVTGFNPASLWGMRQRSGQALARVGVGRSSARYLPAGGEPIGYWRLRDWLRLLGFEVDSGSFGCYRPPVRTERWLARYRWMDAVGDRWWPVLGAVYAVSAVKHVRGMRLVGLAKRDVKRARTAPAAVAHRQREVTLRSPPPGHPK